MKREIRKKKTSLLQIQQAFYVEPFNLVAAASLPLPEALTAVDDVTGCLSWLDKQKAASFVVYVSFGVARPPEKKLMEMAQALEASGVPFLWSLKDNFKTPLLNELLIKATNGMVVPWAPQPHEEEERSFFS
ncbi:hypothetical protein ACE6H2_023881 [Prunus campanulata]